jgi:hypothetical protein
MQRIVQKPTESFKQIEYEYPFEELLDILKKAFVRRSFTPERERGLSSIIDTFGSIVMDKLQIPILERKEFKLAYNIVDGDKVVILCGNLYTACIMFGRKIPFNVAAGQKLIQYRNGDIIRFVNDAIGYVYIKCPSEDYEAMLPTVKMEGFRICDVIKYTGHSWKKIIDGVSQCKRCSDLRILYPQKHVFNEPQYVSRYYTNGQSRIRAGECLPK